MSQLRVNTLQNPGSAITNIVLNSDGTTNLGGVVNFASSQTFPSASSSTPPSSPTTGSLWYDTSSSPPILRVWNGSSWVAASNTGSSTAPTSPILGQTWVDTTSTPPVQKVWNGASWVPLSYTIGNSAPTSPTVGQLWNDTATSPPTLKQWDGASWVVSSGGGVTSVDVSGGTSGLTFSGGPITSSGTITLSGGVLAVANGGTGASTLAGLQAAALPTQAAGNAGEFLYTDGSTASWQPIPVTGVTSVTAQAPLAVDLTNPQIPDFTVTVATTGAVGVVQVGTNLNVDAAGIVSVPAASTTAPGAVQLNDTLSSTSTTEALTAAQGAALQAQISALGAAGSGLILAGTFDAATSQMLTVSTAGAAASFTVGSDIPAPAVGNADYFVIVTVAGSYSPPGGGGPFNTTQGDWLLSDGTAWEYLNVGLDLPVATTGAAGVIQIATNAEVIAGTDTTKAVTPAGGAAAFISKSAFTAKGELITATGAGAPSILSPTSDGFYLVLDSLDGNGMKWEDPDLRFVGRSFLTGKGAIITASAAGTPSTLSVGSDGQILSADSASPGGLKWITGGGGGAAAATLAEAATGVTNAKYSSPETSVPKDASGMTGAALLPGGTDAERAAISSPVAGMIRYNSQAGVPVSLEYYDGSSWTAVGSGSGSGTVTSITAGTGLTGGVITTTGTIGLAIATTSDLGGVIPDGTTITVDAAGVITAVSGGAGTVTNVTGTAPIQVANGTTTPAITVDTATTGQLGVVQVGTNIDVAAGVISVKSASTTDIGIVQLNDTLASTSTTEALTAAQGKVLQDQISSILAAGGLTLAGTFDASTSQMITVTTSGSGAGFTVASDLPAAAVGNDSFFVIVTVPGSYNPPGGGGPYTATQGDWFVSNGSSWEYLNVGVDLPTASTGTAGIVQLATSVEVGAGTDNTKAITPAGGEATYLKKTFLDAKGDIISADGADSPVILSVGSNGDVLTVDSTTASGLKWAAPSGGGLAAASLAQAAAGTSNTVANTPQTSVPKDASGMTGAAILPSGDISERPTTPTAGMTRLNTELVPKSLEVYDGANWQTVTTGGILPPADYSSLSDVSYATPTSATSNPFYLPAITRAKNVTFVGRTSASFANQERYILQPVTQIFAYGDVTIGTWSIFGGSDGESLTHTSYYRSFYNYTETYPSYLESTRTTGLVLPQFSDTQSGWPWNDLDRPSDSMANGIVPWYLMSPGAGSPGGHRSGLTSARDVFSGGGAGGVLLIIATGNVTIGANSKFLCWGGRAAQGSASGAGSGGGGGAGGTVIIQAGGNLTIDNSVTFDVSGGNGSDAVNSGGAGSNYGGGLGGGGGYVILGCKGTYSYSPTTAPDVSGGSNGAFLDNGSSSPLHMSGGTGGSNAGAAKGFGGGGTSGVFMPNTWILNTYNW